jgi:hypothetical protein
MKTALNTVPAETYLLGTRYGHGSRPKTRGDSASELLLQAKIASLQNLRALQRAIREVREQAQGVASGGDLYPWPLQDFARRSAEELLWREKSLQLLIERQQRFSALPHDAAA